MSKVYSSWLLASAVVFSTAHAPTFDNAAARALADDAAITSPLTDDNHVDATASFPREYTEEDDLKRFGIDEFHLPSLDITPPALFEWSDADRAYLASDEALPGASSLALDHAGLDAFHGADMFIGVAAGTFAGASTVNATLNKRRAPALGSLSASSVEHDGSHADGSSQSIVSEIGETTDAVFADDRSPDLVGDQVQLDNDDFDRFTVAALRSETPREPETAPTSTDAPDATSVAAKQDDLPSDANHETVAFHDQLALLPPMSEDLGERIDQPSASQPVSVPTPGALPMFVLGLAGLLWTNRTTRRRGTPQPKA